MSGRAPSANARRRAGRGSRAAALRVGREWTRPRSQTPIDGGRHRAERLAELRYARLHLDDHHVVGQIPPSGRHHEGVVERDHAGHRLGHGSLEISSLQGST